MGVDKKELYKVLGERLKEARVKAGVTQNEVAERVGLLRTSVTNIESGLQRCPLHVLYEICDALKAELDDVLPTRQQLDIEKSRPIYRMRGEMEKSGAKKSIKVLQEILPEF